MWKKYELQFSGDPDDDNNYEVMVAGSDVEAKEFFHICKKLYNHELVKYKSIPNYGDPIIL